MLPNCQRCTNAAFASGLKVRGVALQGTPAGTLTRSVSEADAARPAYVWVSMGRKSSAMSPVGTFVACKAAPPGSPRSNATARLPCKLCALTSSAELQPWIPAWNGLAHGVPFRRWEWLESWWNHYGPGPTGDGRQQELFVLAVLGSDRSLVGLAPWYIERSASRGRVVGFLGSGEVCSEYLSLLCRGGEEETVAQRWPIGSPQRGEPAANRRRWLGRIKTFGRRMRRFGDHAAVGSTGPARQRHLPPARNELLAAGAAGKLGSVFEAAFQIASQAVAANGSRLFSHRPGRYSLGA